MISLSEFIVIMKYAYVFLNIEAQLYADPTLLLYFYALSDYVSSYSSHSQKESMRYNLYLLHRFFYEIPT